MIHDNVEVCVSVTIREVGSYPSKTLAASSFNVTGSMDGIQMSRAIEDCAEVVMVKCRSDLALLIASEVEPELEF
jgi:hypothetical protein